jgi:plasmid maintenance system antidote protein VapI
MNNIISIIKGIHPGIFLERELRLRSIKKGPFAISLNEYPQTIVSITKGKRKMNTSLALKIEKALGFEEGFFMILQVYNDIEKKKSRLKASQPDLSKLRSVLFWDTKIEMIDWEKQKNAVIKRVFERGNETEKQEIERFYGTGYVTNIMKSNVSQTLL